MVARPDATASTSRPLCPRYLTPRRCRAAIRYQSTAAVPEILYEDTANPYDAGYPGAWAPTTAPAYPSPLPDRALQSAKLAALHARLSLSQKLPLQTLARALVDKTADGNPAFNNANLALLGYTLINYHVCEWLICRYPRLPMMVLYEAMRAYSGNKALFQVAKQWGVEAAAAPGDEVDPGLLQFRLSRETSRIKLGYERPESDFQFKWRHSISSRVIRDDDFGDLLPTEPKPHGNLPSEELDQATLAGLDSQTKLAFGDMVHADLVRAVTGAVYAHCGRESVKAFVRAHVLARHLDPARLFRFKLPTRELSLLCAREGFEPPIARLLSETGRLSRTPVFVVGIYSGHDKLGEGAEASLDLARTKAAINALKAWYLYSPGADVRVPSDMLVDGAEPWQPSFIDVGEVI